MGLVFQTTKWTDSLWYGHCTASRSARQVLHEGAQKHWQFPQFASDVHAALKADIAASAARDKSRAVAALRTIEGYHKSVSTTLFRNVSRLTLAV